MLNYGRNAGLTNPEVIDPYWDRVVLYLRGDNNLTDETGLNTVTATGTASSSSGQSKFGGYSLYRLAGAGNYFSLSNPAPFRWGTADFTVEFWLWVVGFTDSVSAAHNYPLLSFNTYANGVNGGPTEPLMLQYDSGGTAGSPNTGGSWRMAFYDNTAIGAPLNSNTFTTGQWNHFACSRSGGTIYLSVNGKVQNLGTSTKNWSSTNINNVRIGLDAYSNVVTYYMDEVRVTDGIARYTSNFVVPVKQFPTRTKA